MLAPGAFDHQKVLPELIGKAQHLEVSCHARYCIYERGIRLAPLSSFPSLEDRTDDVPIGHRIGDDSLLEKSVEEHAARGRRAPIEAEHKLVQIGVEVLGLN
jgi:hypothetical protein